MNRLTAFLKKLRLRQIVTVFLATIMLMVSTACSGGTLESANPNNPAVQAGGANNPYKSGGGDSYTNLKMSTDPKVSPTNNNSQRDQATLQPNSLHLIATNKDAEILYPGGDTPGRAQNQTEFPLKTGKDIEKPEPGGLNQRNSDFGERAKNRLEAVQETFKDAAAFIKDKADEAGQRPEFQSNPALHK